MKKILLSLLFLLFSGLSVASDLMNQSLMEKTIKNMAPESEGEKGFVKFNFSKTQMYLISDIKHNRMRIIAPIIEYKKLSLKHLDAILESNFHKSLDARYAVSKGILYSAFIHPLAELNEAQIKSAVKQVANLALSFGKEYSSGTLTYAGKRNTSSSK